MSKIIVTGGAGFIGSHLVDTLVQKGHRVLVIDDLSSGFKKNINSKAEFIKINICSPQLKRMFNRFKPDYVYHCAAQKSLSKSVENPQLDAKINIIGSLNLLENCHKYKVKKIVFCSTGGAIYGDTTKIPTTEKHSESPVSPYGVAKLAVDKYLHYYRSVYGLKYISLRLANIYGPRQDPDGEAGVVAIFFNKILNNKQPFINGDGRQTRDYVYVDDVVKANLVTLKNNVQGIYNIGTAKETSVNELFEIIKKISKCKFNRKHRTALPGEQKRSCLSYAKINGEIGWSPVVSLNNGLQLAYNWFSSQLN